MREYTREPVREFEMIEMAPARSRLIVEAISAHWIVLCSNSGVGITLGLIHSVTKLVPPDPYPMLASVVHDCKS
jgi:hypothetical protein